MFAVIHIANFSLQSVLRAEPDLRSEAVGLIDPTPLRACIMQLNAAAAGFGVCHGITTEQAMARCPELKVRTPSAAQEESATEILLQTAFAFSPAIESTAPGICTLALKGLRLEDPLAAQKWAEKIRRILAQYYLDATLGIACTPALALLAARQNKPVSVIPSALDFVAHLPMAALDPAPAIAEILFRWGIHTVGAFLALGKSEVGERLGPAAMALFERVSTDSIRPLRLAAPPEQFCEQMEFEHEIETAEPLLFVLHRFVEQLVRRLDLSRRVVVEFHLRLGLSSGAAHECTFHVPSPTGNVAALFRMLQTHLENVRTDSSILSLQLSALPSNPEQHQFGLFESTLRDPNQFAETLARLTALIGPDGVGTPAMESAHKPDSFRMRRPEFDLAVQTAAPHLQSSGPALRRFRPPLRGRFEFSGNKPVWIRSETFNGAIAGVRGPFFSSGNWWEDGRWAREEWDVEVADACLLRIFRSVDGCFVEGVYD